VSAPIGVHGEHGGAVLAERSRRVRPLRQHGRVAHGPERRAGRGRQIGPCPPRGECRSNRLRRERPTRDLHLMQRHELTRPGVDAKWPSSGQRAEGGPRRERRGLFGCRAGLIAPAYGSPKEWMVVDDASVVCEQEALGRHSGAGQERATPHGGDPFETGGYNAPAKPRHRSRASVAERWALSHTRLPARPLPDRESCRQHACFHP
jgi:hypothetical protein